MFIYLLIFQSLNGQVSCVAQLLPVEGLLMEHRSGFVHDMKILNLFLLW